MAEMVTTIFSFSAVPPSPDHLIGLGRSFDASIHSVLAEPQPLGSMQPQHRDVDVDGYLLP